MFKHAHLIGTQPDITWIENVIEGGGGHLEYLKSIWDRGP